MSPVVTALTIMRFLFPATVSLEGEKCEYKVYEFKLTPGKYKAELSSAAKWSVVREITFWKENDVWMTDSRSKVGKRLAEMLGQNIEHTKN